MDESELYIAWKRIKKDRSTDFIICDLEYQVFDHYREELLGNLLRKIKNDGSKHKVQPLRTIRVPKDLRTTRPGSIPIIEDRVYYQYLVDEIADSIEENLVPIDENVVHSYRYKGK